MRRYFIEVSYRGDAYAGFQKQKNANTIQAEMEKAMAVFFRQPVDLTGSSRTDAGVHAKQNFFHFDIDEEVPAQAVYNLNAILPPDIAIVNILRADPSLHCRFNALSREYHYYIYVAKNPFLADRAFYYPYRLDIDVLNDAASQVMRYEDFGSFSKRRTQVKTKICRMITSEWKSTSDGFVYEVRANRFLRGMVRGLVGTMLQVGRGKMGVDEFCRIIERGDASQADFSVPAHGLWLVRVDYGKLLEKVTSS